MCKQIRLALTMCVQMTHQLRRSPRLLSTMIGRVPTNHCLCQASRDHATPTLVLPVPVTTASIYVKDRLVGRRMLDQYVCNVRLV